MATKKELYTKEMIYNEYIDLKKETTSKFSYHNDGRYHFGSDTNQEYRFKMTNTLDIEQPKKGIEQIYCFINKAGNTEKIKESSDLEVFLLKNGFKIPENSEEILNDFPLF